MQVCFFVCRTGVCAGVCLCVCVRAIEGCLCLDERVFFPDTVSPLWTLIVGRQTEPLMSAVALARSIYYRIHRS